MAHNPHNNLALALLICAQTTVGCEPTDGAELEKEHTFSEPDHWGTGLEDFSGGSSSGDGGGGEGGGGEGGGGEGGGGEGGGDGGSGSALYAGEYEVGLLIDSHDLYCEATGDLELVVDDGGYGEINTEAMEEADFDCEFSLMPDIEGEGGPNANGEVTFQGSLGFTADWDGEFTQFDGSGQSQDDVELGGEYEAEIDFSFSVDRKGDGGGEDGGGEDGDEGGDWGKQ